MIPFMLLSVSRSIRLDPPMNCSGSAPAMSSPERGMATAASCRISTWTVDTSGPAIDPSNRDGAFVWSIESAPASVPATNTTTFAPALVPLSVGTLNRACVPTGPSREPPISAARQQSGVSRAHGDRRSR